MVLRDTNDFYRRPVAPAQTYIPAKYAQQTKQPPEGALKRHAASSPENPQGGQWVKFRMDAGGQVLDYQSMMHLLKTQGYNPGADDGT